MALTTPSTFSLAGQRGLAADANSLNGLNAAAGQNGRVAVKETARQFEALFMQELMKSMRQATIKSGLTDNEATNLGTELLDQQFAQQMTGLKGGLGEMIEKQLSQQLGAAASKGGSAALGQPLSGLNATGADWKPHGSGWNQQATAAVGAADGRGAVKVSPKQTSFVDKHTEAARQVAVETGIPAAFMIGQAAHETGWGRREIQAANGAPSFNLFGIKAGASWKGKVTEVTTTEYTNGVARQVKARFRAYESYAESFRDYAKLIGTSPRYAQVMNNLHSAQAFASGLQKAGYATDPQYASKLSRIINTTLSLQRAQA